MNDKPALPNPTWFIGCGNMGGAILQGWRSATIDVSGVTVIRPSGTPFEGVRTVTSVAQAGAPPKMVVLAVKPQKLDGVAPELRSFITPETVLISILAGVEAASLRERFPEASTIIRAMPNLPVQVRRGVTGLYADGGDWQAKQKIGDLFSALGFGMWMADEQRLAALGVVAGAGPAYVARFVAALAKAGEKRGLTAEIAATLALETVLGTVWMAATNHETMDSIAKRVASPKGTTQAGLAILDHDEVLDKLIALTIDAAARRGAELAEEAKSGSLAAEARLS
jgi:pyrroline-5-carboxylate reductase